MAKSKDALFNDFLADLVKLNPAIEGIVADEGVKTKLREGVLARSEFSQQMDTLKSQREQFATEVAEARNRIAGWQDWYSTASQEVAASKEQLEAYREQYGDLTTGQRRQVAAEQGLSTEQFEKRLNEEIAKRDVAALKFVDDLTTLKMKHFREFNEDLNTTEVFQIAGEQGLPLDAAYRIHTAERFEAKTKAKYDEDMKRAREEGAAEALSMHGLPVVNNNPSVAHVLDIKDAGVDQSSRVSAAVASFLGSRRG